MDRKIKKPYITFRKTHPDAVLPTKAHNDDTGLDVTAVESVFIPSRDSAVVPIGIQVAFIEPGYWFKIEARSGLGFKKSIFPHFGIIDNNYRGDCGIKLYNNSSLSYMVNKGDRIAQLVVYPLIDTHIQWAEEIEETDRGADGFGSSGN